MKTNLLILFVLFVSYCLLIMIGNSLYESIMILTVSSIVFWISYICSRNTKLVLISMIIIIIETVVFCQYLSACAENVEFLEQLFFVFLWCGIHFLLAAIAMFIPQTKKYSSFFWLNGIVCSLLFLYCTKQLC